MSRREPPTGALFREARAGYRPGRRWLHKHRWTERFSGIRPEPPTGGLVVQCIFWTCPCGARRGMPSIPLFLCEAL